MPDNKASCPKLITACLTMHFECCQGETTFCCLAKTGPPRPILTAKTGQRGTFLANFLPKLIRETIFGGTDFVVTG